MSIFFNRRQKPEEDARAYGNSLFTLARSAFDKLGPEELKNRVKDRFLRGLREPVGRKVRQLLPSTYETAVKYATAAEGELDTGRDAARVMDITPVGKRELGKPRFTGKIPTPRNYPERKFNNFKPNPPEGRNTPNPEKRRETRRCFKCQKVGHISRNCFSKGPEVQPQREGPQKPLNYNAGPQRRY